MLLTRVTIPREIRPPEDPDNRDWRCRLLMWHLDPVTKEPISRCIAASLSPGNIDSDPCMIYMFPDEVYAFEVVGGGDFLQLLGEFPDQFVNSDAPETGVRRFRLMRDDDTLPVRPKTLQNGGKGATGEADDGSQSQKEGGQGGKGSEQEEEEGRQRKKSRNVAGSAGVKIK
ncbi:hypothetical protein EST38_g11285 [Candolleomyces aberdarensis]|uniref:Uncharacterized protein n=1 Tax=Candolleomyces aberdarensis TaxID=2316362 RepID=A0A4Q2D6S2_9AGAR|nr:hypothetical protein EST38_g11285 [Candolleomyces aberdarensis]